MMNYPSALIVPSNNLKILIKKATQKFRLPITYIDKIYPPTTTPPLIWSTCPVMYVESSEARYTYAGATSDG